MMQARSTGEATRLNTAGHVIPGRLLLLAAVSAIPLLALSVQPARSAAAGDPAVASDAPVIGVRVGSHPGYGRVVFDWNARTDYQATVEGDTLVLRFADRGRPRVDAVGAPPRNVLGLSAADGTVRIAAREGARFRHFHHGPKLVVDILDPGAPVAHAAAPRVPATLAAPGDGGPTAETVLTDLAAATRLPAPAFAPVAVARVASTSPVVPAAPAPALVPDAFGAPVARGVQTTQALPQGRPSPFTVPLQAPGTTFIPQAQAQGVVPQAPQVPQIPGMPQVSAPAPGATLTRPLVLEQGAGRLVELPAAALTVLVADPRIARVQPASPTSLFIMGVNPGRTNLIATREDGSLVAEFDITVQSSAAGAAQVAPVGAAAAMPMVTASQVQSMIRRTVRAAGRMCASP